MRKRAALLSAAETLSESGVPRRYHDPRDGHWHIQITQGEVYVTDDPKEVLTTVLGSCISACIRDPVAGVGGMNHFLLPEGDNGDRAAMRYGVNAMELLINGVLKKGGARQRFEAKLFGGANVIAALSDVGSRNVAFAERFLADEGIKSVGGNVGGLTPRRIQFWPVSGRARQLAIATDRRKLVEQELNEARRTGGDTSGSGSDIELF